MRRGASAHEAKMANIFNGWRPGADADHPGAGRDPW